MSFLNGEDASKKFKKQHAYIIYYIILYILQKSHLQMRIIILIIIIILNKHVVLFRVRDL